MAVRLLLKDQQNRDIGVFLISAYAPVGNASDDVSNIYLDQLDKYIAKKNHDDILVIGSDCNSSMGHATEQSDSPFGGFGTAYQ